MRQEFDIRAVLTDVDNTILANGSLALPSARVIDAFQRASEQMPIGAVTARQLQKTEHLIRLGFSTLALSNGAQIFDTEKREMVVERVLDPMAVMTIAEELKKLGIPFWVQDNGIDYVIGKKGQDEPLKKHIPLEAYVPDKPFIIVGSPLPPDAQGVISTMIERGYPQLTSFSAHRHPDETVDLFIADKKTNKADAVKEIAERWGMDPKHIMAIGDGLNDIPFMESCGVAVAMGNAVDEVKAKAHHVVSSWDKDGAAEAVERFVLFDRNIHRGA